MKYLILLSAFVMLSEAQRPSYASSGPIGRPGLHSRFKTDNASSSTTTVAFENRVGEDGSTQKIPVDARGDIDLVNTLNSWDRDHQPFWFINADHIEKARNTTRVTQQSGQNQNSQTTQFVNRNQIDSQRNRERGSQGSLQGSQSGFQGSQSGFQGSQSGSQGSQSGFQGSQGSSQGNRGSFQGGQGNFAGAQDGMEGIRGRFPGSQMGRQPQRQDDVPNRSRPVQGAFEPNRRIYSGSSQNEESINGHRHNERPLSFEYRRNFYE